MSPNVLRYPSNASEEYVTARNELLKEERALRDQLERLAEKRRQLPKGAVMKEYTFHEGPGSINAQGGIKPVTLADLGADGRSVVVYHLMFPEDAEEPCGMCANLVDSLNAVARQLVQNANFAVIAKAPIEKLRAYAAKRGWNHARILSSYGTTFNKDMSVEDPQGLGPGQYPGLSVFKKDADGQMRHVYTQGAHFDKETIRGLDLYTPLFNVLDVIPEGRGNFDASNEYV